LRFSDRDDPGLAGCARHDARTLYWPSISDARRRKPRQFDRIFNRHSRTLAQAVLLSSTTESRLPLTDRRWLVEPSRISSTRFPDRREEELRWQQARLKRSRWGR
jgi:hypothetical protein